ITSNSIYSAVTMTPTSSVTVYPFNINNTTSGNNISITGNFIGGTSANCSGTAWTVSGTTYATRFYSYLNLASSTASSFSNNIISNLNFSSASTSAAGPGVF